MIEIADQTRNRWRSILPMFGIGGAFLSGKHGACPICGGTDRFRFDDKDGRGTFFCNQCGAGDGMRLLMLKLGRNFADVAAEVRERLGETEQAPPPAAPNAEAQRRSQRGLWDRSAPILGDDAERYLTGRGLVGPFPGCLRFCATARVTDHPSKQFLPAMLALVTDPGGRPTNVHRTFLENGRKASMLSPRKMMAGTVTEGSAIRLFPHRGRLGVAEGIETALAVRQRFQIPCWSVIDAEKLKRFAIPPGVRELIVFGDNDLNFVGQAAAYELARRASTMRGGPETVAVRIPDQPGSDWADRLNLACAA